MNKWDWSSLKTNKVDNILLSFEIPNDYDELKVEEKESETNVEDCIEKVRELFWVIGQLVLKVVWRCSRRSRQKSRNFPRFLHPH
eukprot:767877-Hanusia_phi.AAC.1